jgi:hypothetical protein
LDFHGGGEEVQFSFEGFAEEVFHAEHAVDFVGALVNAIDSAIAIGSFYGIFGRVAISAVDLDGLVYDIVQHFGAEDFKESTFRSILLSSA